MEFIKKLLDNQGRLVFKGITKDGREFTGKTTIFALNLNEEQIQEKLKEVFFAETGEHAEKLWIITFIKFN